MRLNANQSNSKYEQFLRSDYNWFPTHKYSNLSQEINQLFIIYILPPFWKRFLKYSKETGPELQECWGNEISNAK